MKKMSSKRKLMLGLLGTMGAAALITVPAVTLSSCGTTTSTNVTELKAPSTITKNIFSNFKLGDEVLNENKIVFTPAKGDTPAKFEISVGTTAPNKKLSFEYSTIFNNDNFGESNGFDNNFSVTIAEVAETNKEKFEVPAIDNNNKKGTFTTKENANTNTATLSITPQYINSTNGVTITGETISVTIDIKLA